MSDQRNSATEPVPVGRLTRRAEFVRAAKGKRLATPGCVVQAFARPEDGPEARAGFTATKKIGGAVVRNRAKRRLREAVRRLLPALGKPGVDYVFIARDGTAQRPWGSLLDDVERALISLAPTYAPTGADTAAAEGADGSAAPHS